METIKVIERPEYESELDKAGDKNSKAYALELPSGHLAMVYKDQQQYAPSWLGRVDFSKVFEIASTEMTQMIYGVSSRIELQGSLIRDRVKIGLFYDRHGSKFGYLSDPEVYPAYLEALEKPTEINYLMFIFNKSPKGELKYGFTAKNGIYEPEPKLSVSLPLNTRWTTPLAEWFIKHHEVPNLGQKISPAQVVAALDEVLTR